MCGNRDGKLFQESSMYSENEKKKKKKKKKITELPDTEYFENLVRKPISATRNL